MRNTAEPACRMAGSAGLLIAFTALAGCGGPVSVEEAEALCQDRATLAERPRGQVGLGIGSGGWRSGHVGVEISSDYMRGRDPAQVYNSCVYERSGQFPTRPFYTRDEWRR